MKVRLDQLMVENNLAPTRTKAQSMILAGSVMVDGEIISKAGTPVKPDAIITLKESLKYVSRGGIKLEGALKHFNISVQDFVVLDVGASTGGFTDCVLQSGARHVYAIDVGRGQLDQSLRNNPKVTYKESFHVRELSPETFNQTFPLVVMDVSFISLKKVLPYVIRCIDPQGHILALIKPQFETDAKHLDKGVLKDEAVRKQIIDEICEYATKDLHLQNVQIFDSTLKGPKGNQETFLFARSGLRPSH